MLKSKEIEYEYELGKDYLILVNKKEDKIRIFNVKKGVGINLNEKEYQHWENEYKDATELEVVENIFSKIRKWN